MPINFPAQRWAHIRKVYKDWWERKLERPVINVELYDEPERNFFKEKGGVLAVSAEKFVDAWEHFLSGRKFLGDSYPAVLPDFGAGINAVFVGAEVEIRPETIWFKAKEDIPFDKLHFKHNPDEPYFNKLKEIYRTAAQRFDGNVVLGMTHLNNGIDIVARFYDGTTMAIGLYDDPENIKRLVWENHELFMRYIGEFSGAMGPKAPGYTCWGNIYADEPWMGLQSDFSAMISPEFFEEFVLPELQVCCKKLKYNYYHLDGVGELPHLDMLCEIPELKCIQWVPGAGDVPDEKHWPQVYRKIHAAGKNIWLLGDIENIEVVADQIGTTKGIYWYGAYPLKEEDRVLKILDKFDVI